MARAARCYRFSAGEDSDTLVKGLRKAFPRLVVQTSRASVLSNEKLAEVIGEQTLEAGRAGAPLARKPEMDLLLRLAGTTQISRAIQEAGAKPGEDFLLLVVGDEADVVGFESKDAANWERLTRRQLSRDELVKIERAAILDTERA